MNRRNFLKFLGIGAAGAVPLSTLKVKTFEEKVYEKIIHPEDIIKNPTGYDRLDLNDDVTGVAALLSVKECERWLDLEKNQTKENFIAVLKFSAMQTSIVGLSLSKTICNVVLNNVKSDEIKRETLQAKEFQVVIRRFGDILSHNMMKEYRG